MEKNINIEIIEKDGNIIEIETNMSEELTIEEFISGIYHAISLKVSSSDSVFEYIIEMIKKEKSKH